MKPLGRCEKRIAYGWRWQVYLNHMTCIHNVLGGNEPVRSGPSHTISVTATLSTPRVESRS